MENKNIDHNTAIYTDDFAENDVLEAGDCPEDKFDNWTAEDLVRAD